MAKEIFVAFGVDVDAVAGWLGSYGGEDSPDDISRGLFAGEVGVPRLLELFRRHDLTQTFFWPGHSVETFPEQFDACVAAGHEIGVHGYSHENPIAMTREQEETILDYCVELIERPQPGAGPPATSRRGGSSAGSPTSCCSTAASRYDHSLMHRDFEPVLRARRRLLDADRLRPPGGELDEAAGARRRRPTSSRSRRTGTSTTCRR